MRARKIVGLFYFLFVALLVPPKASADTIVNCAGSTACPIATNVALESISAPNPPANYVFNVTPGAAVTFYFLDTQDDDNLQVQVFVTGDQSQPNYSAHTVNWVQWTTTSFAGGSVQAKNADTQNIGSLTDATWIVSLDMVAVAKVNIQVNATVIGGINEKLNLFALITTPLSEPFFSSGGGGGSGCDTSAITSGELLYSNGDGTCSGIPNSVGNSPGDGFTLADSNGDTNAFYAVGLLATNGITGDFLGCAVVESTVPGINPGGCNGDDLSGGNWESNIGLIFETDDSGTEGFFAGATATYNGPGGKQIQIDANNSVIEMDNSPATYAVSMNDLSNLTMGLDDGTGNGTDFAEGSAPGGTSVTLTDSAGDVASVLTFIAGPTAGIELSDPSGSTVGGFTTATHGPDWTVSDGVGTSESLNSDPLNGAQLRAGPNNANLLLRPSTVAALPAPSTNTGIVFYVNDSTAVVVEGQTCVGGGTAQALAVWNGTVWKCF